MKTVLTTKTPPMMIAQSGSNRHRIFAGAPESDGDLYGFSSTSLILAVDDAFHEKM